MLLQQIDSVRIYAVVALHERSSETRGICLGVEVGRGKGLVESRSR